MRVEAVRRQSCHLGGVLDVEGALMCYVAVWSLWVL